MRAVRVAVLLVASCHLADTPETDCPAGYHPDLGRCAKDDIKGTAVVIQPAPGGTSCADKNAQRAPIVEPDPLNVASGQAFQFTNHDQMDHEVRGADGQVWATVAQGQTSGFFQIVKTGSWRYFISGCTGGTVVVQ
jgi:hypothetical protein